MIFLCAFKLDALIKSLLKLLVDLLLVNSFAVFTLQLLTISSSRFSTCVMHSTLEIAVSRLSNSIFSNKMSVLSVSVSKTNTAVVPYLKVFNCDCLYISCITLRFITFPGLIRRISVFNIFNSFSSHCPST